MNDNFYILITGGRSFHNYEELKNKCNELLINKRNKNITVVTGTSMGTDELARNYARDNNFNLKIYKTEWENYNGDPMVADIIDYMAENYPDELALIFESGDDEVEINYIYPQDKSSDKTPEDIRHKNIKNYWNEVYHQYHGGNHPMYRG